MKKTVLFIMVVLVCGTLFASCAAPKYVHKDPAFSYEYPMGYGPEKLLGKNEVAHFADQNQYKVPRYQADVTNREKGVALADAAVAYYVKEIPNTYPGADRVSMLKKKSVKLSDGSDAVALHFKWRYTDKVTYIQSAAVAAYKDDKMIAILGSTVFGYTPLEDLEKQCMTLTLNP